MNNLYSIIIIANYMCLTQISTFLIIPTQYFVIYLSNTVERVA